MTGILCPDCGAYISTRFPYHDCKSKDKNMKAYYAYIDGEEWGILVHGETRGKAKLRFLSLRAVWKRGPGRLDQHSPQTAARVG